MLGFTQGGTLEVATPGQQGFPSGEIDFDLSKKGGRITFVGRVEAIKPRNTGGRSRSAGWFELGVTRGDVRNLVIHKEEVSAQFSMKYLEADGAREEFFGYVSVRRQNRDGGWVTLDFRPQGLGTTYTYDVVVTLTYHAATGANSAKGAVRAPTQRRILSGKATWRNPMSRSLPSDLNRERDLIFKMILRTVANDPKCREKIISFFQFMKLFRYAGTARNFVRGAPPTARYLLARLVAARGLASRSDKQIEDEYDEGVKKWVTPYMCDAIREAALNALGALGRDDKTGAIFVGRANMTAPLIITKAEQTKERPRHPRACECHDCTKTLDSHSAVKLIWDVEKWYRARYQCDPPPGAKGRTEVWVFDWYETLDINHPTISPEEEWKNRHK